MFYKFQTTVTLSGLNTLMEILKVYVTREWISYMCYVLKYYDEFPWDGRRDRNHELREGTDCTNQSSDCWTGKPLSAKPLQSACNNSNYDKATYSGVCLSEHYFRLSYFLYSMSFDSIHITE